MSRKEPTDAEWRVMAVEGIEAGEPPMWPSLVIRLLDRLARRAPGDRATLEAENAQLRELLALRPSGHTGPLDDRIPWFIHCGISHGADRPDCIVCLALVADSRPEERKPTWPDLATALIAVDLDADGQPTKHPDYWRWVAERVGQFEDDAAADYPGDTP